MESIHWPLYLASQTKVDITRSLSGASTPTPPGSIETDPRTKGPGGPVGEPLTGIRFSPRLPNAPAAVTQLQMTLISHSNPSAEQR